MIEHKINEDLFSIVLKYNNFYQMKYNECLKQIKLIPRIENKQNYGFGFNFCEISTKLNIVNYQVLNVNNFITTHNIFAFFYYKWLLKITNQLNKFK